MLAQIFRLWEESLSRRDRNRTTHAFEWGLDFVQNGITAKDPRQHLLDYSRAALADSDTYYAHGKVTNYALEGNHLTFTSQIHTIYPKNNTVHGWYFPTKSRGRAVLVLPQWNASAEGHISLCRMLNYFGLSALRLSMPYHDLRKPEDLKRADYSISPNLGRTLQANRQAVIDSRAALDWLESKGYTRFAILGTSLGSCIALITMAHDPRLRLSVQNHVSPFFADVVWTGISTRHVRDGLEGHISLEDLRQIWLPISPKAYLSKLAGTGRQSLLVHALYDYSFLPHLSRDVLEDYRRLGLPHKSFKLYCGHYTSGKFPFNIVLGYAMCNFLRNNL